ncbi:unnamed protein product [Acanthoscelides obtectus]|uniref:Uncharacterized protein n=1 Tax=Acanthoscelides obtectus TaxID=200917 RepID=A0A9P0KDA3_ACAOB|nr:unnamed protein product [Acanthoscelides obtectus]CAK1628463.1 hypothetical protein AOBTE_LOCUS5230 [Acanthoscelides obtectus]
MAIMLTQDMLGQVNKIKWYSEHVRESQYLLQIVKCRNTECCRPRSDYLDY